MLGETRLKELRYQKVPLIFLPFNSTPSISIAYYGLKISFSAVLVENMQRYAEMATKSGLLYYGSSLTEGARRRGKKGRMKCIASTNGQGG